jgi:hypothetical protein
MSRGGWTTRVPARQLSLQSAFQSAGSGNSNVCNVVLYAPTCCVHACTYMRLSTRSHPALLSSPLPFILFSLAADACLIIDQICCRARSTPSTSAWQAWYGTPSKYARIIITYARPDDKTAWRSWERIARSLRMGIMKHALHWTKPIVAAKKYESTYIGLPFLQPSLASLHANWLWPKNNTL